MTADNPKRKLTAFAEARTLRGNLLVTRRKRGSMRPYLFALIAALLSPSICCAAESTCSHAMEIPGSGEDQLVHTADDAKRLGHLYQEFLERPEETIAANRKSTLKTEISVEQVGDEWRVTIQALASSYPRYWKKWIEMTICAADGRLGTVRIHF